MNPIIVIRSAAGLALPVALAVAAGKQRARRSSTRVDSVKPTTEPYDRLTGEVKTVNALKAFVEAGEDPVHAVFRGGHFDRAGLRGCDLTGADFSRASLRRANLSDAALMSVRFDFADMSEANLSNSDLSGASLVETNLWNADLRGAHLRAAGAMSMANIRGAIFDQRTTWPEGFDPVLAGAKSSRAR